MLLVSTAHGNSLGDLLRNPDLQGVVGGVKAVTLGDRMAYGSNHGQKVCACVHVCLDTVMCMCALVCLCVCTLIQQHGRQCRACSGVA